MLFAEPIVVGAGTLQIPALSAVLAALWPTDSFSLHLLGAWEVAVVALYFSVMAALSVYGLHRFFLIALYYRHSRRAAVPPAKRFDRLPTVTVQLPVYNERFVVESLIDSVCRLDYPRHLLEIQVLDDSTDQTTAVAQAAVDRMADRGHPIRLLHRDRRTGYKAGALAAGLAQSQGELVAVFDADFTPASDFLLQTVHHFTDPSVGAVQGRWTYRNRNQSLLTRLQALLLDGHFVFEQGGRSRSGRMFNFNGTAGVLRRAMIDDAGGWQHDTLTEDTELSYRAQLKGWRYLYRQDIEASSELPTDMASFQAQQARWAKGLIQTAIKLLPAILRSDRSPAVKLEAVFHLTANLSFPLMALLSLLVVPASWIRFEHQDPRLFLLDLPIFAATFVSLTSFYLLAQRELRGPAWRGSVRLILPAMAAGVGLTLSNCKAVAEALLRIPSPFQRTAKYSDDSQQAAVAKRIYRLPGSTLDTLNLLAAACFLAAAAAALWIGAWASLPFLGLFVAGYGIAGGMALYQGRRRPRRGTPPPVLADKPARQQSVLSGGV